MNPVKQKLDALTSLRFFAAVMIVIHHSGELFHFENWRFPIAWGQGVSFFFVLSGFILAYVYPELKTWPEIRRFWRARIARVWPALLVSSAIACWLLQLKLEVKTALANIFMVNAWIPLPKYYFSYNSPSWSISTEVFFYLAFAFLICRWSSNGGIKLAGSAIVVALMIKLSSIAGLPRSYESMADGITCHALLYISPVCRIFEFVFGLFVAGCWRKRAVSVNWSETRGSLYEISAILLAVASMHFGAVLTESLPPDWPGRVWLSGSGSMFAFGLLIYVMAMGRGKVTAILSRPILVLLGEISFSIYLLHQIFIRYYLLKIDMFPEVPSVVILLVFWAITLLSSFLMWSLIEVPGRRLILGRTSGRVRFAKDPNATWRGHFNPNRKTILTAGLLSCLLVPLYFSMGNLNRINSSEADTITPVELQSMAGTRFGGIFMLRGVKTSIDERGLHIDFAWESLVEQRLSYINGIHLTDAQGNILSQADYSQPLNRFAVEKGTIWKDTISIPAASLNRGECKLAIALYPQNRPDRILSIDRGDRDWGNRRVFLDLAK